MNKQIKDTLDGIILDELRRISEETSDERKDCDIERLKILYNLKLEQEKVNIDKDFKVESLEDASRERGFKTFDRLVKIVFNSIWMYKGFKFEQTGVFGSAVFRGLFSKFNANN